MYTHYFEFRTSEEMQEALQREFGIRITDRSVRTYMRWAETQMVGEGIMERDNELLRTILMQQIEHLQRVISAAARDEAEARKMAIFAMDSLEDGSQVPRVILDPESGRDTYVVNGDVAIKRDVLIKSAVYRGMNAQKQLLMICEKTGFVAPRQQIDVRISEELVVLLVQANIAVAYQFIPPEKRAAYIEAASALEAKKVEELDEIVQGYRHDK